MDRKLEISYQHFDSPAAMSADDMSLVMAARQAAHRAFAIYSHFSVGAAVRLASGAVVSGANVESEVFPAGICAERNVLFGVATSHPTDPVVALAVVSISTPRECFPCGLCRQTMVDVERRQQSDVRVIMAGEREATVVASARELLPFTFELS
ncbi:MAG: cytidine deaminase [Rikenellaceae bacterium]